MLHGRPPEKAAQPQALLCDAAGWVGSLGLSSVHVQDKREGGRDGESRG